MATKGSAASEDFSALPLHDASLHGIEIAWKEKRCFMKLDVFVDPKKDATPHELVFRSVTSANIPHIAPWGPSNQILGGSHVAGKFTIDMQSGDIIEIVAQEFELVAI